MPVRICSFDSSLSSLNATDRRRNNKVLAHLQKHPRFSIFEVSGTKELARVIASLFAKGLITETHTEGYPWHNVRITPKGIIYLQRHP